MFATTFAFVLDTHKKGVIVGESCEVMLENRSNSAPETTSVPLKSHLKWNNGTTDMQFVEKRFLFARVPGTNYRFWLRFTFAQVEICYSVIWLWVLSEFVLSILFITCSALCSRTNECAKQSGLLTGHDEYINRIQELSRYPTIRSI